MSAQQPRPTLNTKTSSTSITNDGDLSASLMPHTLKQQQQQHPTTTEPTQTTQTTHNNNNNHPNDSPTSEHNHDPAAAAARAMSHTGAWKPAMDRRQSWDAQEYRHDQHRRQYMCQGQGSGFSEV